jgi:hypothetical protein
VTVATTKRAPEEEADRVAEQVLARRLKTSAPTRIRHQTHKEFGDTEPVPPGKSFVACALTHAAVRRGHTAQYVRTPRLLAELALSGGDGRYVRRLGQLAELVCWC